MATIYQQDSHSQESIVTVTTSQSSTVTHISQDSNDKKSISSYESTATAYDLELNTYLPKEEPYSVFTGRQKLLIVSICCLTGIVSPLSANIYFPALNAIEKDLKTTTELINLTVTVYMIFQGISPSFWGSLADIWGRRPVYLGTLMVYMCSCVGLAKAPVYWVLLVMRMLQAFGSSSVIAIGAGVVSDIATPSERGGYFGIFSMGQMLGPVIGPVLGGIISQKLTWRWIFWVLLMLGGALFLAIFFLLPETLRSLVGNGSGYANATLWKYHAEHHDVHKTNRFLQLPKVSRPFLYLVQKDVIVALVYNGIHYATYYSYLTSTPSLLATRYRLNEIQVGLCFLCQGTGCILGSFVQGRLLDRDFRKVLDEGFSSEGQNEIPIFKVRFRSMYHNAAVIQMITLFYGWMVQINAHLAVILVLQFCVGFANTGMFNVFQTLMVDLFPANSASITATNNLVRCLLGAVATMSVEPGIQRLGPGWMFTLLGLVCVASNGLVPILLVYGPRWKSLRE
ncbi:hypothetical protein INT48_009240 [Thamnidium elegans]|uniref:Major facilitator superfamily (MFS) profile domain-containing protein n=1 Tax=Thamnidium elegans TaxID=101142 RepID=A0A8H7VXK1_9FUNG|nr:hypothetical protein INT48_009240 [Thamnidium elegans]